MKISKLETPYFGCQKPNYSQSRPKKFECTEIQQPNKTTKLARNIFLAGLAGLLTNCTNQFNSISPTPPVECSPSLSNLYYRTTRTSNDDGSYTDIVDGQRYNVVYTDEGYSVTCPDGTVKSVNYEQRCTALTSSQLSKMKTFLENQNALVLADFATEAAAFRYYDRDILLRGYYERPQERINADERCFLHELAHAIDSHHHNGHSGSNYSTRAEFMSSAEREYDRFFQAMKNNQIIFNGDLSNCLEIFAECAALIMSGGNNASNRDLLETYFPRCLALTRKYLDEAHRQPQHVRNSFTTVARRLPDSDQVEYVTYNGQRKVSMTRWDPNKWPYYIDPYNAKFDSKGRICEELISRSKSQFVFSQTHRILKPNTGEVISETTVKRPTQTKRF